MGKIRRNRHGRKRRTHVVNVESDKNTEKSFVMKRGKVGKTVQTLITDVRNIMRPNTAINLKERKNNKLKDFVHVAGPLGVSHFLIFSSTEVSPYLRIARLAHGPTLTFQIKGYTLMRDIVPLQQRPKSPSHEYQSPPLVVLNGFKTGSKEVKLMAVVFQKLFPAINVQTVKLAECKRVVLFSYDDTTKIVSFRHYMVETNPIGVSKSVKRIVQARIPDNLHEFKDISQYILREAKASESDQEDGPDNQVTLEGNLLSERRISKARRKSHRPMTRKIKQRAVKLMEVGPRMDLQLIKVEEDLCSGKVMFHHYVEKTAEEETALQKRKDEEKRLKAERKKQQEENLIKKGKSKVIVPSNEPDDYNDEYEQFGDEEEEEDGDDNEDEEEAEEEDDDNEDEEEDNNNNTNNNNNNNNEELEKEDDNEDEEENDEKEEENDDEEEKEEILQQIKTTSQKKRSNRTVLASSQSTKRRKVARK